MFSKFLVLAAVLATATAETPVTMEGCTIKVNPCKIDNGGCSDTQNCSFDGDATVCTSNLCQEIYMDGSNSRFLNSGQPGSRDLTQSEVETLNLDPAELDELRGDVWPTEPSDTLLALLSFCTTQCGDGMNVAIEVGKKDKTVPDKLKCDCGGGPGLRSSSTNINYFACNRGY